MKNSDKMKKTEYTGVYVKGRGERPWITYIRFRDIVICINSSSKSVAAIKYNLLAALLQGDNAKQNNVEVSPSQRRDIVQELLFQITTETNIQKSLSVQGRKKIKDASTEYVGVYKYKNKALYQAYISKNTEKYSLKYHKTAAKAAAAYNIAAIALYGATAELNDVDISMVDQQFIDKILSSIEITETQRQLVYQTYLHKEEPDEKV